MDESLLSPHWYRVANLRPRIVGHVNVSRQSFRGQQWYVLASPHSGRQFRVNRIGYQFVGRLDGRRTVQQLWDALVRELGNDAPGQPEVVHVLSELASAGMIHSDNATDLGSLFDAQERRTRAGGNSLLAMRVPLFDPTRLLDSLLPFVRGLFRAPLLWLWAFGILLASAAALMHAHALQAYATQHIATTSMLALLWLSYPLIKAVHELAHGLAIRHWGGAVHEVGATLFLLMPVPYVDASSVSAFPEKHRRILVSAMGIIAETSIAALALLIWLTVSDGLLREAAFACMLIGGVSTVLVNANPLMRYDGYHAFSDWLEVPGLGQRSDAWLRHLGERHLLGNRTARPPVMLDDIRGLLLGYGLASWVYRILLFVGITAWFTEQHALAGLAIALYLLWRFVAKPAWKLLQHVLHAPALAAGRTRALAGVSGVALLIIALVGVIPVPRASLAPGIVWLPEEAQLRSGVDGFVERVLVADGERVRAGQVLLQLRNPELHAERARVLAKLAGLEAGYQALAHQQPVAAIAVFEEIAQLRNDTEELDRRIAALSVLSPSNGSIAMPRAADLTGRYFPQGSLLAHVVADNRVTVRAMLGQDDVDLLREAGSRAAIRLAEAPSLHLPAALSQQVPAAGNRLPSAALGDRAGGVALTDPADPEGLTTLEPFFTLDFTAQGTTWPRLGGRAWVRIEHASAPLALQWLRHVRQTFLRQFVGPGTAALGTDSLLP